MPLNAQMKLLNLLITSKYFFFGGAICAVLLVLINVDLAVQSALIAAASWALGSYLKPIVAEKCQDAIYERYKEKTSA